MIGLSIILFFLQSAATATPTPTPIPEPISNFPFYLSIVATAILSFIFGVLVTTIFFISKRAVGQQNTTTTQLISEIESPRIAIKQCPKCHSTYTDEDLKFCLRDGLTLKTVGSMPIPHDPDKTKEFSS